MKKYINRQARDEKRAQEREARASRKSQDQALKLSAAKLAIHAAERVLLALIKGHESVELAVIEKMDGDQLLRREAQLQGFYGSLVAQYGSIIMPYLQQLLAMQAAQSGLELEEDDDGDDVAAAFAAMSAARGGLDYDEAEHYHEHLAARYEDDSEEDDIINLG